MAEGGHWSGTGGWGMQQRTDNLAEPSMEDILASIRKIISEEPVSAKPITADKANGAPRAPIATPALKEMPTPPLRAVAPQPAAPPAVTTPPPAAPSRLSDIMRELAPSAVRVSAPSLETFHDDLADLVEAAPEAPAPVARPSMHVPAPEQTAVMAPARAPEVHVARLEPIVETIASTVPTAQPVQASRSAPDFGSFVPSSAESIGMTSPRPLPMSMGSEFRSMAPAPVQPSARAPVIEQIELTPEPALESPAHPEVSEPASDPLAAAQSALGALALGLAAPSGNQTNGALTHHTDFSEVAAIGGPRRSLDDSIVEMLGPMVRQWLDANLPEMVEKALRQELANKMHLKH
jgi:cell pole-organizing protein PopZ